MIKIPNEFILAVAQEQVSMIDQWWQLLSEKNRQEVVELCNNQTECTFIPLEEFSQQFENPLVITGRHEDPEHLTFNNHWHQDMYEYLVAHPEVRLAGQFEQRTFHICTAHEQARKTLQAGIIPADFVCPFQDNQCLMHKILNEVLGKSVVLIALKSSEKR